MDYYRGFWKYKEEESMERGGVEIAKNDMIYVLVRDNDNVHVSHNKKTLTIRCDHLVRYFEKETDIGHPPSECKSGGNCWLCQIWIKRRNC